MCIDGIEKCAHNTIIARWFKLDVVLCVFLCNENSPHKIVLVDKEKTINRPNKKRRLRLTHISQLPLALFLMEMEEVNNGKSSYFALYIYYACGHNVLSPCFPGLMKWNNKNL